jgi:AAA domain
MELRKVSRRQVKLKMQISGTSGCGKTFSSLLLANGMTNDWSKIALIDTENGSGDLYESLGDYNVITLNDFSPERYIEAISLCEKSGIEVIIIDSLTHSWDWLLEYHSQITANDPKGNSYTAWAKVRPIQTLLRNKILQSQCHIICCVRKETEYSMNNDNGKINVQKVGLKDINAKGFDYEVSLVLEINQSHFCTSTKDRTGLFINDMPFKITQETGLLIKNWCNSGKSDEILFNEAAIEINNSSSLQELTNVYIKYKFLEKNEDFLLLLKEKKNEFQ